MFPEMFQSKIQQTPLSPLRTRLGTVVDLDSFRSQRWKKEHFYQTSDGF